MGRWEKIYQRDRRVLDAPPSRCARSAAEVFARHGKSLILDVGCGAGRDTIHLVQSGLTVIGADREKAGIAIARRRCGASFLYADARLLPFADGAFDGIYSFGLLHEFTSMERDEHVREAMSEMRRCLRAGGILILAVLSGDFRFSLPDVYVFSERMFREATKDFDAMEIREYEDVGCTGKTDYKVWYGVFRKKGVDA